MSRLQHRLDPRRPLVLDTRELGRRPGSMREVRVSAPAPEGLGIVDLVGVPAGAELDLDLRLESVMEGVLVTGAVSAPVTGQCGRCLEDLGDTLGVRFQELFVFDDEGTGGRAGDDADDDEARMQGDLLDLEPVLRDAVVLALPLTPLCREDCEGLCATCGERVADLPDDHGHAATDVRWSALEGLRETLGTTGGTTTSTTTSKTSAPTEHHPTEE